MTHPKQHYRTCNICEAMCGLIIEHDDQNVLSIKPDPNDPLSRGHICPKAVALQDFRTDPDRITKPLRKQRGEFVEIGWDEALDFATHSIRAVQSAHGMDGMALYLGNPNAHKFGNQMMIPGLVKALGSKNRYSSATADQIPHHVASIHMLGNPLLIPVPDVDRTDFMLILGGNPVVSNGSIMTAPGFGRRMDELKARGGQIVVVDPRRTETAKRATQHLSIRPESDAFLLLALIHVVLDEGLDNLGHLSAHVTGMAELRDVVGVFSPERASTQTGLTAEQIRDVARTFARAGSAVCYARMGASTQRFGGLCQWACNTLNIITGNFDTPGGAMFTSPAVDLAGNDNRKGQNRVYPERRSRVSQLPHYNGEFPIAVMAEEMETPGPGQIKGLVTIAGNPVLTAPNGRRIETALAQLDFMMSVDIHINDTTRHADLILPGTVALEEVNYDTYFHSFAVRNTAGFSDALFDPPCDNPQEWELLARLTAGLTGANSLGPEPKQTLDTLLQKGFHPDLTVEGLAKTDGSVDLGPLERNLVPRLQTQDGTIHLAPRVYLDDLPRLLADTDQIDPRYPYAMIGRRQVRSHNSWTQNSQRLVKGKNRCTVEVNSQDASHLGITDGALVRITGRAGSVELAAEITDDIRPGVVSIPQGWGQRNGQMQTAHQNQTVSINDLTDDRRVDHVSGNAALNGVPVAVAVIS